jgi:hypothetical protein
MGNFLRVNEYRAEQREGVKGIYDTGHGMRVNADQITVIYPNGVNTNENNVFTVHLNGGAASFVTDWSGVSDINNERSFVRVNRYKLRKQEDGTTIWQYMGTQQGYSARVYPDQVVRVYQAGIGYEADGTTDHNIFTVHLADGREFVTDWAGWEDIQNA